MAMLYKKKYWKSKNIFSLIFTMRLGLASYFSKNAVIGPLALAALSFLLS